MISLKINNFCNLNKILSYIRIFGIFLLLFLLSKVEWNIIYDLFININLYKLINYSLLFFLLILLKSIRFYFYVNYFNKKIKFTKILTLIIESIFFGSFTPAKIGDLVRIPLLRNNGIPRKTCWTIVILERLTDIAVVLVTTFILFFALIIFPDTPFYYFFILLLLFYLLIFICILNSYNLLKFITKFFPIPKKNIYLVPFLDEVIKYQKPTGICIFPVSIISLWLSYFGLFQLSMGLSLKIDMIVLGFVSSASGTLALLPISFSGLGIREYLYVKVLSNYNIDMNQSITISLLDGFIIPVFLLFLCVLIIFLINKFINILTNS